MEQSGFLLLPWPILLEAPSTSLDASFPGVFLVLDPLGLPLGRSWKLETCWNLNMLSQQLGRESKSSKWVRKDREAAVALMSGKKAGPNPSVVCWIKDRGYPVDQLLLADESLQDWLENVVADNKRSYVAKYGHVLLTHTWHNLYGPIPHIASPDLVEVLREKNPFAC